MTIGRDRRRQSYSLAENFRDGFVRTDGVLQYVPSRWSSGPDWRGTASRRMLARHVHPLRRMLRRRALTARAEVCVARSSQWRYSDSSELAAELRRVSRGETTRVETTASRHLSPGTWRDIRRRESGVLRERRHTASSTGADPTLLSLRQAIQ